MTSPDTPWPPQPGLWPEPTGEQLRRHVGRRAHTVVVLDDDPTGTQTVHGVDVLTSWTADVLRDELAAGPAALYLLTNSRSLPVEQAEQLNADTGAMIAEAARDSGRPVVVVSRGDSTLRGHFPQETTALGRGLGGYGAILLVPAYLQAGRVTVGGRHWIRQADRWLPAGESAYARDATFGYTSSDLAGWVAERSRGSVAVGDVAILTLGRLRQGGPHAVTALLRSAAPGTIVACDVLDPQDLHVLAAGALAAHDAGCRVLFRTAASMVPVLAGLADRGPLAAGELLPPPAAGAGRAGLVVVGSHVPTTTAQLSRLLATGVAAVEVDAAALARGDVAEVARATAAVDRAVAAGRDTVLYTSRQVLPATDRAAALAASVRVSQGLVAIVAGLAARPAWMVAKGGITSSDIAVHALGVRRARVAGHLLAGVPVWRAGSDSRMPGLTYVVFPGNVGGEDDLAEAVRLLGDAGRH